MHQREGYQPRSWIREAARRDRAEIVHLLSFLPCFYSRALEWLEGRLDDVERGRARCSVVGFGQRIGGILIETPKGRRRTKISTFYVKPESCNKGLGSMLLARHKRRWLEQGVDQASVTVPHERLRPLDQFLLGNGFYHSIDIVGVYRANQIEAVFSANIH
jgi:GNAT superfamily N-acetyltransferase